MSHATSLSEPFQELLRLLGADGGRAPQAGDPAVPVWRLRSGATMVHEGTPADFVHVVRTGAFKCRRVAEDGYEQVLSFALPGDVVGFDALYRGSHPSSAVVLEDSTVFALPLHELDRLRMRHPALDQGLQHALSRQLARGSEITQMMAAVAAEVRLARFLVWLSGCMAERGQSPRRLRLRMSRRDIASLLGVAHETVSRSFTALAELGLLQVDNRDVEILDAAGLRQCTRSTRGSIDETLRMPAALSSRREPLMAA